MTERRRAMTISDLHAHITAEIGQLRTEIARLRDAVLGMGGRDGIVGAIRDHEGRVRALERWKAAIPPALLIAVASAVIAWRT